MQWTAGSTSVEPEESAYDEVNADAGQNNSQQQFCENRPDNFF
jgi:hypothetical protein